MNEQTPSNNGKKGKEDIMLRLRAIEIVIQKGTWDPNGDLKGRSLIGIQMGIVKRCQLRS